MSIAAQMTLLILLFSCPVLAWDTVIMTMISIGFCFVAKVLNDDLGECRKVTFREVGSRGKCIPCADLRIEGLLMA